MRHEEYMKMRQAQLQSDANGYWFENGDKFVEDDESYLERACEVLQEAESLMRKKGVDYQGGSVSDAEYYPHGWKSFDTMLTTKILRFRSIMDQEGDVNFDTADDCMRDLINYAARCVVWLERNK